jgi:hypothetical protein
LNCFANIIILLNPWKCITWELFSHPPHGYANDV